MAGLPLSALRVGDISHLQVPVLISDGTPSWLSAANAGSVMF